eukprot:gnl/Dysnectes_brevis/6441_a9998_533.p1 GENE.gnl/Dysnectes_brevis/6441_a9998_533~~gnl/Dysnectes_brevis/6441_a9998_533.p1  ORF type:complete len:266 (-),score=27.16 gnl/Dysnectes_brevis/6441_a9998_533:63-839(-)
MRYIDIQAFHDVVELIADCSASGLRIQTKLELYSIKQFKDEKRLEKSLDTHISSMSSQLAETHSSLYGTSPSLHGSSPPSHYSYSSHSPPGATAPGSWTHSLIKHSVFGDLSERVNRKTFIYLLHTLNASFIDYDFSSILPSAFKKISLQEAQTAINTALMSSVKDFATVRRRLWAAILSVFQFPLRTEVYTLDVRPDQDPFLAEGVWSINYFIYSKQSKRVLLLAFRAHEVEIEEAEFPGIQDFGQDWGQDYDEPMM